MRVVFCLTLLSVCTSAAKPRQVSPANALEACLDKASVKSAFKQDAGFADDTVSFNRRFMARPTVLVFPASAKDVTAAVKCAAATGITVQPKSGGHSYVAQALSAGMTIDLGKLSTIKLNKKDNTAQIGAGARLGQVATQLYSQGKRALPHGTCPDVGIGGHQAFGGYGFLGRRYGLILDRIDEHQVVLANGTLVTASATQNADLFFALRGAGGSFGIVTSSTYATVPAPPNMVVTQYNWPSLSAAQAAQVLSAYQTYGLKQAPAELTTEIVLQKGPKRGTVQLVITGGYTGAKAQSDAAFKPLLSALAVKPKTTTVKSRTWLQAAVDFNDGPLSPLPPQMDVFDATSLVTPSSALMTDEALLAFTTYLGDAGFTTALDGWFINFELYGGAGSAIAAVPSSSTAYANRDGLFTFQFYASTDGPKLPYPAAGTTLVQGMRSAIVDSMPSSWPWRAYPNYVEQSNGLPNWQKRYFGANYARLQQLKDRYDPDLRFVYDTSIQLPSSH